MSLLPTAEYKNLCREFGIVLDGYCEYFEPLRPAQVALIREAMAASDPEWQSYFSQWSTLASQQQESLKHGIGTVPDRRGLASRREELLARLGHPFK